MPTSYNGWPASRDPRAIDVDRDFEVLGHKFPGGVKRGHVSTIFRYLITQLHTRVEPLEAAESGEWGWVYKPSANSPDLLSCHSSATAIDYNAPLHPNRKRGTWSAEQRREIGVILDELDGVVRWLALRVDGGSAKSTPDEMHFEIRGNEADVARVAQKLAGQPAPTPQPEDDDMPLLIGAPGAWYLLDGGRMAHLEPGTAQKFKTLGCKEIDLRDDQAAVDKLKRDFPPGVLIRKGDTSAKNERDALIDVIAAGVDKANAA